MFLELLRRRFIHVGRIDLQMTLDEKVPYSVGPEYKHTANLGGERKSGKNTLRVNLSLLHLQPMKRGIFLIKVIHVNEVCILIATGIKQ